MPNVRCTRHIGCTALVLGSLSVACGQAQRDVPGWVEALSTSRSARVYQVTGTNLPPDEATMKMQAAVDEMIAQGGGTLMIAAGTHRIRPIRFLDARNVRVTGEPGARLLSEGPSDDYRAHGLLTFYGGRTVNVEVDSIEIDGQYDKHSSLHKGTRNHGIAIYQSADGIYVHDTYIHDTGWETGALDKFGDHICIGTGGFSGVITNHVAIIGNRFFRAGRWTVGRSSPGDHWWVSDNTIIERNAISHRLGLVDSELVDNGGASDMSIVRNTSIGVQAIALSGSQGHKNIRIRGNRLVAEDSDGKGSEINPYVIMASNCENLIVEDNVVVGTTSTGPGVFVGGYARHVVVQDNSIDGGYNGSVRLEGSTTDFSIVNNLIWASAPGAAIRAGKETTEGVIEGNRVTAKVPYDIKSQSVRLIN